MGAVGKVLFVFAVLTALYGYMIYPSVPEDIDDKHGAAFGVVMLKVLHHIGIIGSSLGLGTRPYFDRVLLGSVSKQVFPKPDETLVKEVKSIISGVPVRIYQPVNGVDEKGYSIIYFHGGGWTHGNGDEHDFFMRDLVDKLKIPIISVLYRLAPEHPFPAATDDCLAVTKSILQGKSSFKVNPNKIILMGDSAGGNLAAVTSIRLRDEKIKPNIKLQVILHGGLQLSHLHCQSYDQMEKFQFVTYRRKVAYYILSYCGGDFSLINQFATKRSLVPTESLQKYAKLTSTDLLPEELRPKSGIQLTGDATGVSQDIIKCLTHPHASPILTENLKNLPEALVIIAGHDGLRDDNLMYAKRLEMDGNKVTVKLVPAGVHDDFIFAPPLLKKEGKEAKSFIIDFLKEKIK